MTLQELLNEAQQLSLPEQIHLATCLLKWVEQQVNQENPSENRSPTPENPKRGSIDYLMLHPFSVQHFTPLSREEIYDR